MEYAEMRVKVCPKCGYALIRYLPTDPCALSGAVAMAVPGMDPELDEGGWTCMNCKAKYGHAEVCKFAEYPPGFVELNPKENRK